MGTMRVHNFGAGPCALPRPVLEEVSDEFPEYGQTGMTVVEMSHRSPAYDEIHGRTKDFARRVSGAPDDFEILFLQGGATLQFSMVPMNLLEDGDTAGYVVSGAWGKKALADGALLGGYPAWSGEDAGYSTMPGPGEVEIRAGSRYLHVTSNETIGGIRMVDLPDVDVPIVTDMSSDYLARPVDWDRHALVYGGVQKNLAPAGMALVFVRRSVVEARADLGTYLRYSTHVEGDSLANTPPMFQVYVMGKVLAHLEDLGGIAGLEKRTEEKANAVYQAIEASDGFYRSPVDPAVRSHTNVVWRLPDEDLERRFVEEATERGMVGLKGHRSVGGIRASLYAATEMPSVEALVEFMGDFARRHR
ncbi:MAG TPA: 3-phosphoserine/phosphohydroxythreonine transaminase [Acidimicrobiia bacterium]|nr:3-phosphoserine/phosphohydroxythreonine transaminase [Acidimicrobiia bacterium]